MGDVGPLILDILKGEKSANELDEVIRKSHKWDTPSISLEWMKKLVDENALEVYTILSNSIGANCCFKMARLRAFQSVKLDASFTVEQAKALTCMSFENIGSNIKSALRKQYNFLCEMCHESMLYGNAKDVFDPTIPCPKCNRRPVDTTQNEYTVAYYLKKGYDVPNHIIESVVNRSDDYILLEKGVDYIIEDYTEKSPLWRLIGSRSELPKSFKQLNLNKPNETGNCWLHHAFDKLLPEIERGPNAWDMSKNNGLVSEQIMTNLINFGFNIHMVVNGDNLLDRLGHFLVDGFDLIYPALDDEDLDYLEDIRQNRTSKIVNVINLLMNKGLVPTRPVKSKKELSVKESCLAKFNQQTQVIKLSPRGYSA
jgi:hypothetical protein